MKKNMGGTTCFCAKFYTNSFCSGVNGFDEFVDGICNADTPSRCTGVCPYAPATQAKIAGTVRRAASLQTMIQSAKCATVTKSAKNGSYQRVLMRRKKCLV
jgi:hypothetical protein